MVEYRTDLRPTFDTVFQNLQEGNAVYEDICEQLQGRIGSEKYFLYEQPYVDLTPQIKHDLSRLEIEANQFHEEKNEYRKFALLLTVTAIVLVATNTFLSIAYFCGALALVPLTIMYYMKKQYDGRIEQIIDQIFPQLGIDCAKEDVAKDDLANAITPEEITNQKVRTHAALILLKTQEDRETLIGEAREFVNKLNGNSKPTEQLVEEVYRFFLSAIRNTDVNKEMFKTEALDVLEQARGGQDHLLGQLKGVFAIHRLEYRIALKDHSGVIDAFNEFVSYSKLIEGVNFENVDSRIFFNDIRRLFRAEEGKISLRQIVEGAPGKFDQFKALLPILQKEISTIFKHRYENANRRADALETLFARINCEELMYETVKDIFIRHQQGSGDVMDAFRELFTSDEICSAYADGTFYADVEYIFTRMQPFLEVAKNQIENFKTLLPQLKTAIIQIMNREDGSNRQADLEALFDRVDGESLYRT